MQATAAAIAMQLGSRLSDIFPVTVMVDLHLLNWTNWEAFYSLAGSAKFVLYGNLGSFNVSEFIANARMWIKIHTETILYRLDV